VVKPVDGSGQRGVVEVTSADELASALHEAFQYSRTKRAVVERYLTGQELTVSGFCVDGEYQPVIVAGRTLFPVPPLGVARAHRFPSGLDADAERAVFAVAEAATHAVGIDLGPSYVQVRRDGDSIVVIEIGSRLGGGKDAELAQLVTGIDQVDAVVSIALGEDPGALTPDAATEPFRCGQVWFTVRDAGHIDSLAAEKTLTMPGVIDAGFYYRPGMDYPPFQNGAGRLGYIIVVADTLNELDARTAAADAALDTGIRTPHAVG
jgi:biotin carboxylase